MTPRKKRHVYQQKHQPQPKQQKAIPKRESRKKLWIALALLAILFISIGGYYMIVQGQNQSQNQVPNASPTPTASASPTSTPSTTKPTKVLLHTNMGDITIELRTDMPITTGNFIKLVRQGTYNGVIFHRVIPGFMIQGGDPTGTGYGDPSIPTIQDEIGSNNHNYNGTIAMANTGQPNSASRQFFINVANNNNLYSSFDSSYTVFGKVLSGMNVVMNISKVTTNASDKPTTNVTLLSASILS